MQKPYRGDYKPDYEKWKNVGIKEAKFTIVEWFVIFIIIGFLANPLLFFMLDSWETFNFKKAVLFNGDFYIASFLCAIIFRVLASFSKNYDENLARQRAENEAEQRYQEDLDRWYHYQDTEDEVEDRKLARDLKRKRAMGQIDDERLIYQYSQLQAIQYQTNQQALEFFQQAQQALRYDRKSDLDYSLDQLERALGV